MKVCILSHCFWPLRGAAELYISSLAFELAKNDIDVVVITDAFETTLPAFEEHENVNFYTLRFHGEETEVDKFLDKFPEGCEYDDDIDVIIKKMDQIGERGALKRYFRPEGKNVWAVPIENLFAIVIPEK